MTRVYFVCVAADGEIMKTGHCAKEDVVHQGDAVVSFDFDPMVTSRTHKFNHDTNSFEEIEARA